MAILKAEQSIYIERKAFRASGLPAYDSKEVIQLSVFSHRAELPSRLLSCNCPQMAGVNVTERLYLVSIDVWGFIIFVAFILWFEACTLQTLTSPRGKTVCAFK